MLGVWTGNETEFDSFLLFLNSLHPSIEFTFEGKGVSLSFLDLKVHLTPSNFSSNSLLVPKFSIHDKTTSTGVSIHSSSFHPRAHKMATIHSAVNRLIRTPLTMDDREMETRNIQKIAHINGLNLDVKKFIKRKSGKRQPSSK